MSFEGRKKRGKGKEIKKIKEIESLWSILMRFADTKSIP